MRKYLGLLFVVLGVAGFTVGLGTSLQAGWLGWIGGGAVSLLLAISLKDIWWPRATTPTHYPVELFGLAHVEQTFAEELGVTGLKIRPCDPSRYLGTLDDGEVGWFPPGIFEWRDEHRPDVRKRWAYVDDTFKAGAT